MSNKGVQNKIEKQDIKGYVKLCALNGIDINVSNKIPIIKVPKMSDIKKNLFGYLYLVAHYTDMHENKKEDILFDIFANKESISEFVFFMSFFVDCSTLEFRNSTFVFDDHHSITFDNISDFIEVVKIIHHRDKNVQEDKYKPANSLAERMLAEARKRRAEIEQKIKESQTKDDNGIGFLEIISTICARHPSINLINIDELNYYQIIDQYKRLFMIDAYTPCLYGNATSEYIKDNKIEHYSSKIIDKE